MSFKVIVPPEVFEEVEGIISYYNTQINNLGAIFLNHLNDDLKLLAKTPHFQIRYSKVRCLPMKNFLFLFILRFMRRRKRF